MTDSGAPAPFLPLLTADDVAIALNVSIRTVRRLIADQKLPYVRIGRSVRIRPEALKRLAGKENDTR